MVQYRTSKYTDERFAKVSDYRKTNVDSEITIDSNRFYQEILGFGGAFTEASAYNLTRIRPEIRKQAIRAYFDSEIGLGYNLGRVSIHSCDFSLGSYSYVQDYDRELSSFTIERDKWLVIPFITDAMKYVRDNLLLLASPWTPVWWMKDNKSFVRGGHLLEEFRDVWAMYYTLFIREYEKAGIPIWGITVQNEPAAIQRWDSCIYSKEEERDFVRDHLGPMLRKAGYSNRKLLIWDHNRDLLFERAKAVYDDPKASEYVWGAAFHWYVSDDFSQLAKVHEAYPNKHLLFTEGCIEGGPHFDSWESGERYGYHMINDFLNFNEGFIDWNLFLDETGGPNHVNNLCDAPIMIRIWNEELVFQSSYYYIGHFSKFVKRKAKRIDCKIDSDKLIGVAFKNPDGTIVAVVQNASEADIASRIIHGSKENYALFLKRSVSTILL